MWTEDFGSKFKSGLLEVTKCGGICSGCSQALMGFFVVFCSVGFGFVFFNSSPTDVPVRVTKRSSALCIAAPSRMDKKHLPFFLSIGLDLEVHPFQRLLGTSRRE